MERRAAGFRPAGVVAHRRGVRAVRQFRADAAVAIPQASVTVYRRVRPMNTPCVTTGPSPPVTR